MMPVLFSVILSAEIETLVQYTCRITFELYQIDRAVLSKSKRYVTEYV